MTREMKKEFTYNLNHSNYSNIPPLAGEMMALLKNHHYGSFKTAVYTAIIGCTIEIEHGNTDPLNLKQGFETYLMHDIGKLGMSPEFLNFSGRYKTGMFDEMKKHSEKGADLLKELGFDVTVYEAVEFHHSNFNSSGYPGGKKEEAIPFHSRVIRIADSVNAFLTRLCGKEGELGVFNDLDKWTGDSYDPNLITSFESLHNKVMDACKKLGVSDPSQTVYMERLVHLYSDSLPLKSVEEVEQHYSL